MSPPRVTRFFSRSVPSRRMMGSGEQGVSICFTTRIARAGWFEPHNEIASPIVLSGKSGSPLRVKSGLLHSGPIGQAYFGHAAAATLAAGSLPERNAVSSLHIRCRTTASIARYRPMPRVLAICIPQARRLDHL